MKYVQKYILLLFIAFLFTNCDECDDPILPPVIGYNSLLYGDAPTFEPATPEMIVKKVLIEDFTGHHCGNCPDAAVIAEDLKEGNPENISIMAIHAGEAFAYTDDEFPTDWTSAIGDVLWSNIPSQFNPGGRINRSPISDQLQLSVNWESLTDDELAQEPDVVMQIETSLEEADGIVNIHIFSEVINDYEGQIKMVAYVTESELFGPQLDYSADPQVVENYHFEHLLRDVVNGNSGVNVGSGLTSGYSQQNDYSYEYSSEWVIEHCSIIAITYNSDTGNILNVVEQEIN